MAVGYLTLDSEAADFIVDLANVVRKDGLCGPGGARLDRFYALLDGLRRFARDQQVSVYAVADESLLFHDSLSPRERKVLRAWVRDGLIEARTVADDRILELADLTDLMIVTDDHYKEYHRVYPWLPGNHDRFLTACPDPHRPDAVAVRRRTVPVVHDSDLSLIEENREYRDAGFRGGVAERMRGALLGRLWECPDPSCPLFGGPPRRIQPLPRFTRQGALCPTHRVPMADRGRAPRRAQIKVLVEGSVVTRFTLEEGTAKIVGRAPAPGGIPLAAWLGAGALASMSRSHVELTCTADGVFVRDISSNGTRLRRGGEPTRLPPGRRHSFGRGHEVVLHESVALTLSGRRYFRGEDADIPPPAPVHDDVTLLEGENERVTTNNRRGR